MYKEQTNTMKAAIMLVVLIAAIPPAYGLKPIMPLPTCNLPKVNCLGGPLGWQFTEDPNLLTGGLPWSYGEYSSSCSGHYPTPTITWSSSAPIFGQTYNGVALGNADTGSNCGLSGWNANYIGVENCYWGFVGQNFGCTLPLTSQAINLKLDFAPTYIESDASNAFEDYYADFWIVWSTPRGPAQSKTMEFMFRVESTLCCLGTTFFLPHTSSGAYQVFMDLNPVTVGAMNTYTINLLPWIQNAMCGPNFGGCTWNLDPTSGYITGWSYGGEAIYGHVDGYIDYFNLTAQCYGCEGYF